MGHVIKVYMDNYQNCNELKEILPNRRKFYPQEKGEERIINYKANANMQGR